MSFFHYTSIEGIKGIIENKEMWASNINFLNDQKEWLHFDDVFNDAIRELVLPVVLGAKTYNTHEELIKDVAPLDRGRINEFSFVLSFSKTPDCKSQWMEYCPRLSGYALEFSESPIIQYKGEGKKIYRAFDDEPELAKCIYNRNEQIEHIKSIVVDCSNKSSKDDQYASHNVSALLGNLKYQFKHEGFKEEQEYRWYGRSDSIMDVRPRNGIMIPFVKVKIDIRKLSAIWVGPRPNQDKAAEGLGYWWSVLQKNDSSYIYKNKNTGI